jgi:hypothetical protein
MNERVYLSIICASILVLVTACAGNARIEVGSPTGERTFAAPPSSGKRQSKGPLNKAGLVCLGARAHSLSFLSGRLLGYKRVVRIFDGATLMWRKMGRPPVSGKACGAFSFSRRSLAYSSAACRASCVRRSSVRDCLSGPCVSGSVDIPVLQHSAPTRVVEVPDILSRVAPHLGGGFHSERKKNGPPERAVSIFP